MRNTSAASLAKSVERAEQVLLDYNNAVDAASNRYALDTEAGVMAFSEEVIRPRAAAALADYETAVDAVAEVFALQWHRGVGEVREIYLDHADAWLESLQLAAAGDFESAFFGRVDDAITDTWLEFCTAAATAVPYLDFNGVERSFVYINERGGCDEATASSGVQ